MSSLLHQLRFERKIFRRNPSAAFFNFVLPLLLLLLVASVFADDDDELEVLIPGIAGHEHHGHHLHRARVQHDVPARAGDPEADPRHADPRRRATWAGWSAPRS